MSERGGAPRGAPPRVPGFRRAGAARRQCEGCPNWKRRLALPGSPH